MTVGRGGPLAGVRVVELGGVGPVPFCGMVLSDMGADVIQVGRPRPAGEASSGASWSYDQLTEGILSRGRRRLAVDLKHPRGVDAVLAVVAGADMVVEGFRPGVAERLGVGPDRCLDRNPALVYGRITGWGQDGPLAASPGHDLDYLAVTGALAAIGPAGGPPVPPLNLVADFGGGGMLAAMGLLAGLIHARATGEGQVVDAAMTEGAAYQMTMMYELAARGAWVPERGANVNDGGAPWYATYETSDGGWVAVAAMETRFYVALLDGLGIDPSTVPDQWDRAGWPALRAAITAAVATDTRDGWCRRLEGSDACLAPVLAMSEAPVHPQVRARGGFVEVDGVTQPAPAPRFSATPSPVPAPMEGSVDRGGAGAAAILAWAGVDADDIGRLRHDGVIGDP